MTMANDLGGRQVGGVLLTIDVRAEIRKLCGEQFSCPADRLVELIRLVIRFGARAVRVNVGWRWVTVETIGGMLPIDLIEYLMALADPRLGAKQRHRALVALDAAKLQGLMALLGAPRASLYTAGPTGELQLNLRGELAPTLSRGPETAPTIRLRVARRGGRHEELRAIQRACRFSSVPIFSSGRQVSGGMRVDDCLIDITQRLGPLECRVGLPRTGELCQTTMLCQEVVFKESFYMSRRGFIHLAVVRDVEATSVDQMCSERVKALVHSARKELYRRLRTVLPQLSSVDQKIVRNMLFRRCERSGDGMVIYGLRMFRRLSGDPVDLDTLRSVARDRTVWAVEPNTPQRNWLVPAAAIYVLDGRDRDFLGRQVGLSFVQPPSMSRDGLVARLGRACGRLGRWTRDSARRLLEQIGGAEPLSTGQLLPIERVFIMALQTEITSGRYAVPGIPPEVSRQVQVTMARRGSLPLRLRRRGDGLCLLVPRRHPDVVRMVTATQRDAANLYPAFAVLFGGHDGLGKRKAAYQELLIAAGAAGT
ncbi:MAG: hypothetical protein V3T05_10685 [Myxococcota bacterium]